VLTTGNRTAAYQKMGAAITTADKRLGIAGREFVSTSGEQGFGFAGQATDADLLVLRYAFIMGSTANQASDPAGLKTAVDVLTESRVALAALDPKVLAAVDRYLAAAREGNVDGNLLANAFSVGEAGIATGDPRGHGYFVTGLWLGLSLLYATNPGNADAFCDMASPLSVLLEQDAVFGGTDMKLAAEVRRVGSLLRNPTVDIATLRGAIVSALSTAADAP
jgi:hypothetical protein